MLDEYKRKRNFKATPEPNGNKNPNDENSIITDNTSYLIKINQYNQNPDL